MLFCSKMEKQLNLDVVVFIFRNRRSRETAILKAIENGAETLFDIVANVYAEVDCRFWKLAASNVRLHVDHLAQQDKLPKVTFPRLYDVILCQVCIFPHIKMVELSKYNSIFLKLNRVYACLVHNVDLAFD